MTLGAIFRKLLERFGLSCFGRSAVCIFTPPVPMKSIPFNSGMILAISLLAQMSSTAVVGAVLADDTFGYDSGSALNGAAGGSGWSGAWVASSLVSVEAGGTARFGTGAISPNGNELAYRTFDSYSGDALFVGLTINASGHEGNDFFALWLDHSSFVGTGGNHGVSRVNTGMSSGNLFMRLSSTAERTSTGAAVAGDQSYRIVVEYSKSVSGADQPFDTVSWWINPTSTSLSTPTGTISGTGLTTLLSTINTVGFRGANNEASDQYRIDDLVLATTWGDIVSIPEPSAMALAAGSAALASVIVLRRRGGAAVGGEFAPTSSAASVDH